MTVESLVQFTHDNIPPIPEAPVQGSSLMFEHDSALPQRPMNGVPLFELVPRRKADGSFDNVEFVSILTPGDTKAIPRHKVTDSLRERYRPYYELWRRGLQASPVGTPLEMWPILTPAQVHELKATNIFTVEQLCDVSDVNLSRLPMGIMVRQQARDWLASKKDADVLASRTAEVQALRDGQDMLRKQLAEMGAQLTALKEKKNEEVQVDPTERAKRR